MGSMKKWILLGVIGLIFILSSLISSHSLNELESRYNIEIYEYRSFDNQYQFIDKQNNSLEVDKKEFMMIRTLSIFVFMSATIGISSSFIALIAIFLRHAKGWILNVRS